MYTYDHQLTGPEPKPTGSASRTQPLAFARGAFIGQPPTPPKAAPTVDRAGADRINRVSKTMTQALRLAMDALPFLKTAAQKELLRQMVGGLGTFFPTGFGVLNEKGKRSKARRGCALRLTSGNRAGPSREFIYMTCACL